MIFVGFKNNNNLPWIHSCFLLRLEYIYLSVDTFLNDRFFCSELLNNYKNM